MLEIVNLATVLARNAMDLFMTTVLLAFLHRYGQMVDVLTIVLMASSGELIALVGPVRDLVKVVYRLLLVIIAWTDFINLIISVMLLVQNLT